MSIRRSPSPELALRFPGLWRLSQDYLSNAWDYSFGTPQNALLRFRDEHPDLAASAASGIDALFDERPNERAREDALDELDWGYAPDTGQLDAFLTWARDALRQPERAAG